AQYTKYSTTRLLPTPVMPRTALQDFHASHALCTTGEAAAWASAQRSRLPRGRPHLGIWTAELARRPQLRRADALADAREPRHANVDHSSNERRHHANQRDDQPAL